MDFCLRIVFSHKDKLRKEKQNEKTLSCTFGFSFSHDVGARILRRPSWRLA